MIDRTDGKQASDKKKVVLFKDKSNYNKPLYSIANTIKNFTSKAKDIEPVQSKSSRNTNSFMNKVRAKNEKQLNNMDYFSFSSPTRENEKENGSSLHDKVRN